MSDKIVICGAGGYVGSRLVRFLLGKGYEDIRAVSFRPVNTWKESFARVENLQLDLRDRESCERAVAGAGYVYNLAAKVGGIGYIANHRVEGMLSSLINTHLVQAISQSDIRGYFFSSSSCVYHSGNSGPVFKESDAYPANPTDGYGWEKLFSERLCLAFADEMKVPVRIARFHTIYGPGDVRPAGQSHVTESMCEKVIAAKLSGKHEITIWGDGKQTRSFLYIDDCIEGIYRIMNAGLRGPVNLANSAQVSVNDIVTMLEEIAGIKLTRFYNNSAVVGQQDKCSDNTLLRSSLGWEPSTPIKIGLERMYEDYYNRAVSKK